MNILRITFLCGTWHIFCLLAETKQWDSLLKIFIISLAKLGRHPSFEDKFCCDKHRIFWHKISLDKNCKAKFSLESNFSSYVFMWNLHFKNFNKIFHNNTLISNLPNDQRAYKWLLNFIYLGTQTEKNVNFILSSKFTQISTKILLKLDSYSDLV